MSEIDNNNSDSNNIINKIIMSLAENAELPSLNRRSQYRKTIP